MSDLAILYDGACSLCRAGVARVRRFDRRGRLEFLDLHDLVVQQRFPQIDHDVAMRRMQAVDSRGRVFGGAEAWARVGLLLPGWNLLAWVLLVPGIRWLSDGAYSWIARNRYRWNRAACADGTCSPHLPLPPGGDGP